jgi:hypothetical protein
MSWFRRVFGYREPTPPPAAPSHPSPELKAAKKRQAELLNRGDTIIREAMAHADEMFGQYHGPERRRSSR